MDKTSCVLETNHRQKLIGPYIFVGGAIPDAAAIHMARKKREAMRAGKQAGDVSVSNRSYIPLNKNNGASERSGGSSRRHSDDDEDDDSDADGESRMNFTGVRSAAVVKTRQLEKMDTVNSSSPNSANSSRGMYIVYLSASTIIRRCRQRPITIFLVNK